MTNPPFAFLPSMAPVEEAPTPKRVVAGGAPQARDTRKVVSPFYLRYLNDQATAIRLRAQDAGLDGDAAIQQFLAIEEKQKVAFLPAAEASQAEMDSINRPGYLRGLSMAVIQGATYGFGDEALGAIYGALSPDITSEEGIDIYRRQYETWAKDNRKSAFAAEFAGTVGTTLLTLGGGAAAAAATRTAPSILRMAATASGAGAVAGAGHSQGDIDSRMWGALMGGAAGLAGGVVLGGAGRYVAAPLIRAAGATGPGKAIAGAVESGIKRVTQHELVNVTPESRMRELLVKTWLDEGITYQKAMQAIDDFERAGIKAPMFAVGGDATRDLVGSAAKNRSPATTAFLENLKRNEAQVGPELIHSFLEKGVAPQRLGLAYAYDLKNILETQALAASRLPYEAAFKQVVQVTPLMKQRLRHPKLREAWERIVAKTGDDDFVGRGHGLPVTSLRPKVSVSSTPGFLPGVVSKVERPTPFPRELPVRGIDELKKELDAMVEEAFPPIQTAAKDIIAKQSKRKKEYSKTLFALYDDVVREAVKQVPIYGRALSAYGGPMEVRDLVALGEKAWRMKGQDIARKLARIEPNKREFVRIGYARAAYERMIAPGTAPTKVAEKFFGGRQMGENSLRAEQVRALFPDEPLKADEFLRLSAGQARITEATGGILKLARNVVTEQKKEIVEGAPMGIRGQIGLTLVSAARGISQRSRANLTQEEADELTHLALRGLSDPNAARATINDLFYTYAGVHARRMARKPLTRAAGAATGAAVGSF